jgi:hypothetical protein
MHGRSRSITESCIQAEARILQTGIRPGSLVARVRRGLAARRDCRIAARVAGVIQGDVSRMLRCRQQRRL